MSFPILRELAKEIAPLLAPLVAEQLRGTPVQDGWVAQKESKLGRNKHIAAVRRLHAEGDTERAIIQDRIYLLRKDAYDAELTRSSQFPAAPAKPPKKATAARDAAADDRGEFWRRRLGGSK